MSSTTKGGEEDIVIPVADAAVLVAENSITTSTKKKKKKKKKEKTPEDLTDSNMSSNMPTTSDHSNGSSIKKKKKKKKKDSGIDVDTTNNLTDSNTKSNIPINSGHSGSNNSSSGKKKKEKKDSDDIDVDTTNDDMMGSINTSTSLLPTSGHSGSVNSSVKKRKKKKKNSNKSNADISSDPSSTIITMSEKKIVSSITKGGEADVIAIPVADVVVVPVAMENGVHVNEVNAFQVPGGRWKNGLFSCCNACLCPCIMGWCCVPILLGQVVERLKYATSGDGKSLPVCWIFAILTMIAIIIEIIILSTNQTTIYSNTVDETPFSYSNNNIYASAPLYYQILVWVIVVWAWFICIISCCTRMKMRKQYHIEPSCCGDNCCDDCCISWYCNCCSIVQMARQTHDEVTYPYDMTSRTGLGPGAPEIV